MDDDYDRELEHQIAEDIARKQAQGAVCTVCRVNYVDVMLGEDTCPACVVEAGV